jgi:hypothetical protein
VKDDDLQRRHPDAHLREKDRQRLIAPRHALTDEELLDILNAATPGPWDIGHHGTWEVQDDGGVLLGDFGTLSRAKGDARLAALAPALAREVLYLRTELSQLTEAVKTYNARRRLLWPD